METTSVLIFDVIGLTGVVFYIAAYAALQFGLLKGNGYTYTIMNLIAATLVLVSLSNDFNLSSAIIQTTWIAISVFGLTRYFILHHSTKLSAEEAAFARSKLPNIPKPMVRQFFLAGSWADLNSGTVLATEGEDLNALVYLLLGEADVSHGGHTVATLKADSFVGELTCFDGGRATATVTLNTPARVFKIASRDLAKLCNRNAELKVEIEQAIRRETGIKLVAANSRLRGDASRAEA